MRPSCPYCQKVTNFLSSQKKSIPTKDIGTDKNALNELIQKGGKRQVPCLMINGKPLYESNDIINWLKKHKGQY
ncbi:MAG: glutaredoxin [Chlamydiia bacterium]|nr:glutaredoxin [Chlamydiia bacterium]